MSRPIQFLLPLVALSFIAPSARATDLTHVKCAVNQDRVWVYDSLGSFDVAERLHCGASVEVLSRTKGYVKVRTESGVEGFVPDSAFPEESENLLAGITPQSLATESRTPAASTPDKSLVAAAAKPAKPLIAPTKPLPSTPTAPEPVVILSAAVPAPVPVKVPAPPAVATVSARVSTPSTQAKTTPVKKPEAVPGNPSTAHILAPVPNAAVAPARPSIETVSAARRDSATMVPATALPSAPIEELDEDPNTQPDYESADPACRVYFAAYGLAPSQYKWLAENRRKEFSEICPAPDLAHVDYVVLFTHDSDSYTYAMPTPVHTDHSGFSDFSPLAPFDTALIKASEVEKARYEFVWVFRVTRGAFDPAKFSARRRPQFTTYVKGPRAPSRAIEDAFSYVQTQGVDR